MYVSTYTYTVHSSESKNTSTLFDYSIKRFQANMRKVLPCTTFYYPQLVDVVDGIYRYVNN